MAEINSIDFTSVFNGSPFQTIVWAADDPKFTILAQNDRHAATTLNGAPKKIGIPLMEAYPDTSEQYLKTGVSTLVESIRKTIKTKKMDTMPIIRYDIMDGNGVYIERYWQASHYPLFDTHNNVYAVFQVTEDITKSMKTDKELDRVNIQLENALNLARIGTWQWHIPTGHVTADKTVAKMFGISPKVAAAGLPVDTFIASIHPSDRVEALRAIDRTVKNHEPYNHEYRTVSTNGSVRWTNARGQVELDSAGNALNFPGVIIDITETKQAALIASFLAKASAQLAGSLDYVQNVKILGDIAVPEIVDWIAIKRLDESGQLKQIVVKHCDDTKTAWAEKIGLVNGPIADRAIKTRQQQFYPDLAHAPASVKKEISHELNLRSLCISPIMVNGQAVGTLSIGLSGYERLFTDADSFLGSELAARVSLAIANATLYDLATDELSKREVLQAELKQANERLEKRVLERTAELNSTNLNLQRSNQELQDFAYVASHDLQEPLRKIQAFGNLLQDEYASELGEGSDYLNRMRSAAARMSILIEDLLSFSRVTTDARPFTSVNLNEVLAEVLEDLENRIDTTGGTVESEDLPTINADHTQIRQLLQNLVGNALKFHKVDTPPIVKVACQVLPNTIELSVTDNGVGFDEKYLDRIFAVFQRLHGRDVYEGTGIGLAVCRKIVERHGGSITATSQLDNGASFIVSLAK